jgi:hypothetical protein
VSDPGDAQDLIAAFESEQGQSISNAKKFLESYDELKQHACRNEPQSRHKSTTPMGDSIELLPTQHQDIESKTWVSRDTTTAILLHYANYRLIRTEVKTGSVEFIFAWDSQLTDVVKRFNKNEWLVSPKRWTESAFVIRNIVRNAKGYGNTATGLSNADAR